MNAKTKSMLPKLRKEWAALSPRGERWTIVSNGPSIATLDADHLMDGSLVVCINNAITHPNIRADVWCWHESPGNAVQFFSRVPEGCTLWGCEHDYEAWQEVLLERPDVTLSCHPKVLGWLTFPWTSEALWTDRAAFMALGNAIRYGGKRLRLLGFDLEGTHDYGGNVCTNTGGTVEERWEREQRCMDTILKECREHGVVIEWIR